MAFEQRALEGLRAIPGVEAAGATTAVPFSGDINNNVIMAEGYVMKPGESLLAPTTVIVAAGYFEAMHVPARAAAASFDARDTARPPRVAIIDERLAQQVLAGPGRGRPPAVPAERPEGHDEDHPQTRFFTVVGVVKEMQVLDPRADITPVGAYYFPFEQNPPGGHDVVVRTRMPSTTIISDIRRVVAGIDPQLPVFRVAADAASGSTTRWSAGACRC